MGKLIFITGGARSGKSSFAADLAPKLGKKVIFVATALAIDKEMKNRIARHIGERPKHWTTIEAPTDILNALKRAGPDGKVILIDCLTIYLTNLIIAKLSDAKIEKHVNELLNFLSGSDSAVIIVSNEVGLGIVPVNKLARRFRDLAGKVNRTVAEKANEAYLLVSGIPVVLKRPRSKK